VLCRIVVRGDPPTPLTAALGFSCGGLAAARRNEQGKGARAPFDGRRCCSTRFGPRSYFSFDVHVCVLCRIVVEEDPQTPLSAALGISYGELAAAGTEREHFWL
jgi:hypothetical protein